MSRWFRWYDGTSEDGKFRVVARMSRVTVRDVLALWAFMLEDASNLAHRGVCQRNEDFMSAVLDFDDGAVETILEAMEDVGLVSVGFGAITISNWGKRQFEGDADPSAARRQREKRQRDKAVGHGPVTRDSRGSDTDTDTDTEKIRDADASLVGETAAALPVEVEKQEKTALRIALQAFGEAWNELAWSLRLPAIDEIKPGSTRERHALARLREIPDQDGVFDLMARIRGSPYLRGEVNGFRCTFDWLVNASNFQKIMEGNYEDRKITKIGR